MQGHGIAGQGSAVDIGLAFFSTIFAGAPPDTAIVLTTPREGWRPHAVPASDPLAAARVAVGLGRDVFVGVGLQDLAAASARRGRGTSDDVVALTATGADIDIAKPGAKKHYLPDRAAAERFLAQLPIRPTVTVWSGGGFQVWSCFKEALGLDTDADRSAAQRLLYRWQAYLRQRLNGYALDATHDLARVLRVPHTINSKYNVTVVLDDAGGPRVDPGELEDICINVPNIERHSRPGVTARAFALDADAEPPFGKFARLCRESPLFERLWRREITPKDSSQSGFDFRLATLAAVAGWTDDEIVGLLIAHRRTGGKPPKHASYYALTLTGARTAAAAPRERATR